MKFLDSNYFLRYIIDENSEQRDIVVRLFNQASKEGETLFTNVVVIFEIYWVLSSFYEYDKNVICEVILDLLKLHFIKFDDKEILYMALQKHISCNLSFEDCYHLYYYKQRNGEEFLTFDKKLLQEVQSD